MEFRFWRRERRRENRGRRRRRRPLGRDRAIQLPGSHRRRIRGFRSSIRHGKSGSNWPLVGGIAGEDGTLADGAIPCGGAGLGLGKIGGEGVDGPGGIAEIDRLCNGRHVHDGIVGGEGSANARGRFARDGDRPAADGASAERPGHRCRHPHRGPAGVASNKNSWIGKIGIGAVLGDVEDD